MSSSLTAGTGATAGAEAEVASFTETADGCCIRGGRERRGFEAMRERGREMRLKLAAKTNSRPSFWVSVLSCKRASVDPTRARAPRVVPSHFTREAHRINGIHRKRKRTVGMVRPLRRDDEEEEDADEEEEEGDATALVTIVRLLLPEDEEATEPEASRLWGIARERCIARKVST